MKAVIDAELCTGCELCTQTCPDVFEMEGEIAKTKVDVIPSGAEECAKQASEECPVEAIKLE